MFTTVISVVLAILVNLISDVIYDWLKNQQ